METLGFNTLGQSFDCACGEVHSLPIEACYVGSEAAEELAAFAKGRCGKTCLVVSDENTRQAAGDQIFSRLGMAHKNIVEKIYPAEPLEATLEEAEAVAALGKDLDFYVVIGSGTLSDLAKYAGSQQKKTVLLFPTAASMNGYTSGIVALKVRGLKRTLPCQPATGIFADPEVVATAPQRMTAAGVADFLSKCASSADWHAGHLIRGDYYCPRPREFSEGVQPQIIEWAPAIGASDPAAVALVLEALLLSGFGMVLAGSSAPASGGEHLISHYLDMKHALYGTKNDLHGVQVGVGTLHALMLWEKVLSLSTEQIDVKALVDARPREKEIREWVMDDWGSKVGKEVMAQWRAKSLNATALKAELETIKTLLPKLRAEIPYDWMPAGLIAQVIAECGGVTRPQDMTAPMKEYKKALKQARFLRNRFTILDLAAELGVT